MRKIKKVIFVATVAVLMNLVPISAQEAKEARNALLIANGDYSADIGKLETPIPEAEALKKVLDELGFVTTIVKNAGQKEINNALYSFNAKTRNEGGIAFFHYGGHAVQCNGVNYILPTDLKNMEIVNNSETKSELTFEERLLNKLEDEAVKIDKIMTNMNADANIIILDSCRNSPLNGGTRGSVSRGLVAIAEKPKNSIIVYSAEEGKTARDGVFTPILTKKISEKGKSFTEVLTETRASVIEQTKGHQCPGEYNQLTSLIYLAGRDAVNYNLKKTVATGTISITSEFPGKIYLDGNFQGDIQPYKTVILEDVVTARYKLEILGENANNNQTKSVVVKKDEETSVLFKIPMGSIEIISEFAGDIYLDGVKNCSVTANQTVTLKNIKAEENHKVEIRGSETQQKTVLVKAKNTSRISFIKTKKVESPKKKRKNIFAVEAKDGSLSGELQLFYNHSIFDLYGNGNFSGDGFGIDLCGLSFRGGYPASFALELTSGYTFAKSSIGDEHFTFHEVDWFTVTLGLGIMSRFSLLAGVGWATVWQTFENNTAQVSYEGKSDAIHCVIVPIEVKFQLGENVSLFGKYKFLAAGGVVDYGHYDVCVIL